MTQVTGTYTRNCNVDQSDLIKGPGRGSLFLLRSHLFNLACGSSTPARAVIARFQKFGYFTGFFFKGKSNMYRMACQIDANCFMFLLTFKKQIRAC